MPHTETTLAEPEKAAPVPQTTTDAITAVEPAKDIAAPVAPATTAAETPAASTVPVDVPEFDQVIEVEQGWSVVNYLLFFGFICVFGAATWFLGGNRLAKRFLSGKWRGQYRRVGDDDVEKQRD